jgi:hypothetical protein
MNSGKHTARTVVTFHQWKGKGFAVFASLGKLIRIGKLSTTISQNICIKNTKQPTAFLSWAGNILPGNEDEDLQITDDGLLRPAPVGIQPVFLTIIKNEKESQPLLAAYRIFKFLIKVRFLLRAENGLFYCCKS